MDVEALLDDAAVLLDLTETSLERIIHTILTKERDISLPSHSLRGNLIQGQQLKLPLRKFVNTSNIFI